MSKENDLAEENDQSSLNSEPVQDNPELQEKQTEAASDTAPLPEEVEESVESTEELVTNSAETLSEETVTPEVQEAETVTPEVQEVETVTPEVQEAETVTPEVQKAETVTPEVQKAETVTPEVQEAEAVDNGGTEQTQEIESVSDTPPIAVEDNKTDEPSTETSPEQEESGVSDALEVSTDSEADTDTAEVVAEKTDASKEVESPEEEEQEEVDYTTLSKAELLEVVSEISIDFTLKKAGLALNEVKDAYDHIFQSERDSALAKFTEQGDEEANFAFKGDETDGRIEEYFKLIREKRSQHYNQLEKQKEANLKAKEDLLERLRGLVHGEENTASINSLKEVQEQWRNAGPVHPQHNKTLWANYHALINQYYDQRSIYFELKELDRKKNLEAKVEICKKAEELNDLANFNEAVKKLNDLHDEYKHLGPVPRESQEALWQRFKGASDVIYAKRKEFVSSLKDSLQKNLEQKINITDKAAEFVNFESDRITDWNQKTKELLAIQKEWESVGSMPKERAKEINKKFWGDFKTFFQHKSDFFKSLESQREENLQIKQGLVDKANALIESDDWEGTAEALKTLQEEWKEVGPVPEKSREPIYRAFKAACDGFFNRRRDHNKDLESSYEVNLKKKEEICNKLEAIGKLKAVVPDEVYALQDEFGTIGFVPKKAIRFIQKRYQTAIDAVLNNSKSLDEETKNELSSLVRLHNLKSGPNSGQKIFRQEHALKRKITNLENDVSTWKNNLGFFANSKNADELMKDFQKKIEDSEEKLKSLKEELKFLNTLD